MCVRWSVAIGAQIRDNHPPNLVLTSAHEAAFLCLKGKLMPENFRIPVEFLPVGFASLLTATLRALIIGRQSLKMALLTWPVAFGAGFLGGWIAKATGVSEGWDIAIAVAAALMGENIIKGLVELSEQFRDDPDGALARIVGLWRGRGGGDDTAS
jgi:hypothetical protein